MAKFFPILLISLVLDLICVEKIFAAEAYKPIFFRLPFSVTDTPQMTETMLEILARKKEKKVERVGLDPGTETPNRIFYSQNRHQLDTLLEFFRRHFLQRGYSADDFYLVSNEVEIVESVLFEFLNYIKSAEVFSGKGFDALKIIIKPKLKFSKSIEILKGDHGKIIVPLGELEFVDQEQLESDAAYKQKRLVLQGREARVREENSKALAQLQAIPEEPKAGGKEKKKKAAPKVTVEDVKLQLAREIDAIQAQMRELDRDQIPELFSMLTLHVGLEFNQDEGSILLWEDEIPMIKFEDPLAYKTLSVLHLAKDKVTTACSFIAESMGAICQNERAKQLYAQTKVVSHQLSAQLAPHLRVLTEAFEDYLPTSVQRMLDTSKPTASAAADTEEAVPAQSIADGWED